MKNWIIKFFTHFIRDKNKRKQVRDILLYNNIVLPSQIKNMSAGYLVNGVNNKIIIVENGVERGLRVGETIPGLKIEINGNNNTVKLELPIKAENSFIQIGNDITNDDVYIKISQSMLFREVYIRCFWGKGQFCKIGKNTTICSANIILDSLASCIIGEDCMFSNSIRIWGDDGHSILDANTGEILNEPKGAVTIGNHVWVGEAVRITKNARIHDNSIIGGGAVAYKDYEESNVVIAGNPGKIVRRNITWDRRNTYFLQRERESNF